MGRKGKGWEGKENSFPTKGINLIIPLRSFHLIPVGVKPGGKGKGGIGYASNLGGKGGRGRGRGTRELDMLLT